MSARFYFDTPITAPGDLLAEMVDALAGCPLVDPVFYGLTIRGAFGFYAVPGGHPAQSIKEAIRSFQHGRPFPVDDAPLDAQERARAERYGTEAGFWDAVRAADPASLWWEVSLTYHGDGDPQGPDERRLPLSLWTFGDRCKELESIPDLLAVVGRPQVASASVGWDRQDPYVGTRFEIEYGLNSSYEVAQHLDALLDVLRVLTERLRPYSMKVTQEGHRSVLDAGLAYYRDLSVVVEDLRFLQRVWERGLSFGGSRPRPLREEGYDGLCAYFRPARVARQLWRDLEQAVPFAESVTTGDVQAVMESGRQDWYHLSRGHMVLHYPFFLNTTLADFYVDVLRHVRGVQGGPDGGTS